MEPTRRKFVQASAMLAMGSVTDLLPPLHASEISGSTSQRQGILSRMELVMGAFPEKKYKPPLAVEILEHLDLPTISRTKISYLSEEGDHVSGYLLKPKTLKQPVPGILCLHQTTLLGAAEPAGLGGDPNLHYALELAERGYITFAPNYPNLPYTQGFGGYRYDAFRHGYQSTTMKGIWNHRRAIDLLQGMPEVIPDRIACIGHSLGGHNTLFVASFDPRIQVIVSSGGFTSFAKYGDGDLSAWGQQLYMPLIPVKFHNTPAEMPFEFADVLTVISPRPLFINAPLHDQYMDVSGVRDTIKLVRPVYEQSNAEEKLIVVHPDAPHSFPAAARRKAYAFIDKWV